MSYLFLIVKGPKPEALQAAHDHHLVADWIGEQQKYNETYLAVPASYRSLIYKWFAETTGESPYPIGSLLWYSERRGELIRLGGPDGSAQ